MSIVNAELLEGHDLNRAVAEMRGWRVDEIVTVSGVQYRVYTPDGEFEGHYASEGDEWFKTNRFMVHMYPDIALDLLNEYAYSHIHTTTFNQHIIHLSHMHISASHERLAVAAANVWLQAKQLEEQMRHV